MLDGKKIVPLFIICLIVMVIIPAAFAADDSNQTDLGAGEDNQILEAESTSYYFNASAENDDGDGSIDNPYKYLTQSRIKSECNIYLADGEYELESEITIYNVNIYGQNPNKTIVKYNGTGFNVKNVFRTSNLTFDGLSISNTNVFIASNVNFINSHGVKTKQKYDNTFGGAIYSLSSVKTKVTLTDCTFKDNSADYGGAIYVNNGYLTAENCRFINNTANNFGGAIACEDCQTITISKSRFAKNTSPNGSGGTVYIKKSKSLIVKGCIFSQATSKFGGALVSLNTTTLINNTVFENNTASYYGGAVFQMYSNILSENSTYNLNSALNGGAIYADHTDTINLKTSRFTENIASNLGRAIYALLNSNILDENNTLTDNDIYTQDSLNLETVSGNYTLYQLDDTLISNLPQRYSLLDYNLVTPVKNQLDSGNCWAFAAIGVLESCLKKITGIDFDFSEENLKNLMSLYSDYGVNIDTNEGGYARMAIGYLTSWLGPINDIYDVFDDKTVLSPIFESILHVQNVLFLKRDNATDNDAIKEAILKYGGVGTSMYYKSSNLNNTAYYSSTTYSANHAAVIVGWDDTYSKSNFKGNPQGDGAWIVRNSWGDSWGDNGYCYVSYYDVNFARVGEYGKTYTFILNDTMKFDKNYQYDFAGSTTYIKHLDYHEISYKTRFTSTNNEILSAVSTYFYDDYNWTLTVYVNGEMKAIRNGSSHAGYWTIPLECEIPLYIGDVFDVAFNITSDSLAYVPVSQSKSVNTLTFAKNTSFIGWDGKWRDLFDIKVDDSPSQLASIKAFTVLKVPETYLNLSLGYIGHNQVNITARVVDEYGNPAKGNVTFDLDGVLKVMNLDNGAASFIYLLNSTLINVGAKFNGTEYGTSSNSTSFEITPKDIALGLNVIKTDLNNVVLEIASSENINETLTVTVNDFCVNVELVNGTARYGMYNLKNGDYIVNIHLNNTLAYKCENITDKFTIIKYPIRLSENKDLVMYYGAGKSYSLKVYGEDGNPLTGGSVKITLNGKKYNANINSKGYASYKITLKPGKYTITAEYKGVKVQNKITVKTTLITKNIKVKKSKIIRFKAKLLNSKGKAVKNKKVTFKVKSKKYSVKTNKKGIAVLKLKNLKAGKHKIITTYKKLRNTNKITVKK